MIDLVQNEKEVLRKEFTQERSLITDNEYSVSCAAILERTLSVVDYYESEIIHLYISMNERLEVDTHQLIIELKKLGKKVIIPVIDEENLVNTEFPGFDQLQKNKWGVPEPLSVIKYGGKIDLILVPLLAIDHEGNRLGYGKGYYDRFLKEFSGPKIGLVFQQFVVDKIPTNTFDVKLDGFITENEVRLL